MENTGTWNSDLALIFLACLLGPIAFYFFVECITKIIGAMAACPPRYPQQATMETGPMISLNNKDDAWEYIKQDAMERAINGDAKSRDWLTKNVFNDQDLPVSNFEAPAETPSTPENIKQEAIMALQGMGFNKTDAKNKINELCSNKKYDSSESLITESFA